MKRRCTRIAKPTRGRAPLVRSASEETDVASAARQVLDRACETILEAVAIMIEALCRQYGIRKVAIAQSSQVTEYVHRLGEATLVQWYQCDQLRSSQRRPGERLRQRTRNIPYDTSGIMERQVETVRICDACGGVLRIESSADRGRPILAIHIPTNACADCVRQGRDWAEEAKREEFGRIHLQDRPGDRYLII